MSFLKALQSNIEAETMLATVLNGQFQDNLPVFGLSQSSISNAIMLVDSAQGSRARQVWQIEVVSFNSRIVETDKTNRLPSAMIELRLLHRREPRRHHRPPPEHAEPFSAPLA